MFEECQRSSCLASPSEGDLSKSKGVVGLFGLYLLILARTVSTKGGQKLGPKFQKCYA